MTIPTFHRPLKVIQWTTGNIGRRSLHAILDRPDLELAGVYALSLIHISEPTRPY